MASFHSLGILEIEDLAAPFVGVMGATIIRGDIGGEAGGVVEEDMEEFDEKEAESGLWESLRRQLQR